MDKFTVEIVPAILAKNINELNEKTKEVEPFVKRVHIDIMDGKFVSNKTIQPEEMETFKTSLVKEAHLMVDDNKKYVDAFFRMGFDAIIVHYESCGDVRILKEVRRAGRKVALAVNPSTDVHAITDFVDEIDSVLLMAVRPGQSGQAFDINVLAKIRELKKMKKNLSIEIDGGIKVGTAKLAAGAGADRLVSCSGIYESADISLAIQLLKNDAQSSIRMRSDERVARTSRIKI